MPRGIGMRTQRRGYHDKLDIRASVDGEEGGVVGYKHISYHFMYPLVGRAKVGNA